MIPKKKPSGLAKKVPAIFEGLPDIGDQRKSMPGSGSLGAENSGKTFLLFEYTNSLLKALLVRYDGKNAGLLKLKAFRLDDGSDGKKINLTGLENALDECLRDFRIPPKTQARIIVRTDNVFLGKTEKPAGPKNQMRDSVIWQLSEKASFPFETSDMRFHERGGMLGVAAIESDWRETFLKVFHSRGIYPEVLTLLPLAYEALQQKKSFLGLKNLLLLDMGEDQSNLMVFQKGQFVLDRQGPYGCEQVLKAMKGTMVIENQTVTIQYQEAQALLAEFGLPTANLAPDPVEPKLSQLSARVRPIFEKLIQEVRATILQHQKDMPSEKIEEVCLSGPGAGIKGFDQYLANQLNIQVRRLDVKRFSESLDGAWAGALGLAFLNDTPFNLTSVEDALLPKFRAAADVLRRLTFLALILFLSFTVFAGINFNLKKQDLLRKEKTFQELSRANQAMIQIQALKTQIDQRKNLLRAGTNAFFYHGAILRELSRLVPDGVILGQAVFESSPSQTLTLSGKVLPSAANPDTVISGFLGSLNLSPFFDHSGLESRTGSGNQKDIAFVIQTDLVKPEELS